MNWMRRVRGLVGLVALLALSAGAVPALAQEAQRKEQTSSAKLPGCPDWLATYPFKHKQFTFVRIQYSSLGDRTGRPPRLGRWATDWPDADRMLSEKLRQHTSLQVDPLGKTLKLTDPNLSDYPFLYMAEPGGLLLTDDEVTALRRYLSQGGFLMLDDFWGEDEWAQCHSQLKRVFPDREPQELPLEHKIFHCVFDLQEKPQVPSIGAALSGQTTERFDAQSAHYRAIMDDHGRMLVLACHNTDLADGWEREAAQEWYYREFSVKKAYPMAFNIIFFALTQ